MDDSMRSWIEAQNHMNFWAFVRWRSQKHGKRMKPKRRRATGRR